MTRLIMFALLLTPSLLPAQSESRKAVEARNGMVVCVCPIASQVGVDVLKAGGNAVDAAVAVAFAEAVTWPEAGNIGGGGFMMICPAGGKDPVCIDYREMAPALATKTMLADGKVTMLSPQSAGVPGTVRGLAMAHAKYGKRPWKELVLSAVKLAQEFVIDSPLAGRLNRDVLDGKSTNPEFLRLFGNGGKKWDAGDKLVQNDLASLLEGIADHGPDHFYKGTNAERIDVEMSKLGGLIRKDDLANYKAVERQVIRGTYRGYEILGAPPVSSGGTTLMLALNMLENFDLAKHPRQSPEAIHLLAEVQRRAYVDRARHLGDPAFTKIPDELYSKDYAKKLAFTIDRSKATKSETLAPEIEVKEGTSTTHFSVIDSSGMAVSNTYTLENAFGCRIVVPGCGFILNNEMTDFNPIPGTTTRSGKIGTDANTVAPGKRMLSSMCPIIVRKDGKPLLITGSPGGRTIINTVLCVTVNVLDYNMEVQAAVDEPRQHHQWFPDRLQIERLKLRPDLATKLNALGHETANHKQGDAHTIWIDPKTGSYHGAADSRLNGKATGY